MHFTIYYFVALFFLPVFGAPYPKPAHIREFIGQGFIVGTLPNHNGEATKPHPAVLDGTHPDGGYSVFPISTHPPSGMTTVNIEKLDIHTEIKGHVGLKPLRVNRLTGRYINTNKGAKSEDPKARSTYYYSPMNPDSFNKLKGYAELHKNGQKIPESSPPVSPVSGNGPSPPKSLGHPSRVAAGPSALKGPTSASSTPSPQKISYAAATSQAPSKVVSSNLKGPTSASSTSNHQPQTPSPPNPAPPADKISYSDALKKPKSDPSTSNQPQTPSPPNPAPPAKISYSDALKKPKSDPSTSNQPQTPSPPNPAPPAAKPKISYSDALKQNSKS